MHSDNTQQIALFDLEPLFKPVAPPPNTREYMALALMASGQRLTTPMWQRLGYGWRLAATIHNLSESGWMIERARVKCGNAHIGIYSLSTTTARLFREVMQ